MALTGKQKRFLRGLAHGLPVIVSIGGKGLSDNLINELNTALEHHELVKLKLPPVPRLERQKLLQSICAATHAEAVQSIGRTSVIFRASDPAGISLP